jgi:hypothetical protein
MVVMFHFGASPLGRPSKKMLVMFTKKSLQGAAVAKRGTCTASRTGLDGRVSVVGEVRLRNGNIMY